MKKTTYNKSANKKITKNKKDIEEKELELTNIYKYQGKDRTKAKIKNNARIAKFEAEKLKQKYKKGGLGQKILILLMLFLIFCLTIGILFTLFVIINSPKFDGTNLYSKESSVILDKDGNEYARLGTENRDLVTYDELPQVLIDAIVATEDSRFFQHNGVDLARFSKAVLGQLLGQSNAGGGSTLTMQVVKNTYTSTTDSGVKGIIRKFTDIYMSVFKVEKNYTKEQIIEFYVNIPYLGSGSYGVEQASQTYFGKSAKELSLSEAALIAGLFQAPGAYDPYSSPDKAESRRNTVLNLMKRHGYIDDKECELAKKISVKSLLTKTPETLSKYQSFVDTVIEEVVERTGNDPYTTSMKIYSTLNPTKQDVIEKIYSGESYTWKNDVVQAGIAVIDVKNGSVAAIGGGRNKKSARSYNYATMIKRHPGSTAKPLFDYGPAIEYLDWSTGQTVVDDTFTYSGGGSIKNWDNGFKGIMTAKSALAASRNIPALYTFQQLTQEQIKGFVTNLGITPEYENGYINESHSIGGFNGVSPLQMAAAYSTFSRGGTYIEPYSFTKIEYTNSSETYTVKPKKIQAMSDSTAYMINMILKYAITSGNVSTGTVSGTDVASKTGTSTVDSSIKKAKGITASIIGDSWQMSYSPDYTIGLWYGYDEITKDYYLTNSEGGTARRTLSKLLGTGIFEKNSTWKKPSTVVEATIELQSDPLALASDFTPDALRSTEYFKKGTAPTEVSSRFSQLDNPTNVKTTSSGTSLTITWDPIKTPKAIDTNYLSEYFSKNVYSNWGDKYLNQRLSYNSSSIGTLVYNIYIDNTYIGNTSQTSYTYNGVVNSGQTVTVRTSYSIFTANQSSGASVVVSGGTSNTTTPSTNGTVSISGPNSLTTAELTASNIKDLYSVYYNGNDVTSTATITFTNNGTSADITATYNGVSKTKTITLTQ